MKILIVDDEEPLVKSTRMYLKTKGFKHVETLTDSRLAIDKIKHFKPDILTLDLNMPYVSGKTILKMITELDLRLKIIVISAADSPDTINECMQLGASDYLIKPLDSNVLMKSIQQLNT